MAWWSSHIASLYGHALLAANGTRFRDKIHGIVWHIDIAHWQCVCRHASMMLVTSASLIISVRAVFVVSSSRPLCERQVFSYCPHLGFQNRYTEQGIGCVLTDGGSMPGLHGIFSCAQWPLTGASIGRFPDFARSSPGGRDAVCGSSKLPPNIALGGCSCMCHTWGIVIDHPGRN
jgi:hypothetical protein